MAGVAPESVAAIEGMRRLSRASRGEISTSSSSTFSSPRRTVTPSSAELRADPGRAAMRVVALTANVTRREVLRCREAGFDGFIGKPIDGRRFSELLRKILEGEWVWMED